MKVYGLLMTKKDGSEHYTISVHRTMEGLSRAMQEMQDDEMYTRDWSFSFTELMLCD